MFDPFGEQVRNKNKASHCHHTTCLQLAILLEWFDFDHVEGRGKWRIL
jgi:hypothetical protein